MIKTIIIIVFALIANAPFLAAQNAAKTISSNNEMIETISESKDSIETLEESEEEDESIIDAEELENEIDSLTAEDETFWSYSAFTNIKNKSVKKGVIVGKGKALTGFGSDISYRDLTLSASASKMSSANIWTDYSIGLDYSYDFTDWFGLSCGYSHFKYLNDSTNPNSDNSNSLSLTATFYYSDFSFDIDFSRNLGDLPVNYISLSAVYIKSLGDFKIISMIDVTNSDYAKENKAKTNSIKKITNLKSLTYSGAIT
ncbi:MAG: hypothetical protein WCJ61_06500, partial [Paludibacter sp.]